MTDYSSNTTVDEIAQRLLAARRIALTTHVKPDGDALGSVLALERALRDDSRTVEIWLVGPLEPCLRDLVGDSPIRFADVGSPADDFDLIVVTDTGAWSQLEQLEPWLRRHHDKVIGFDHHAHGDDVASSRIVDVTAASTTELLVPVLDAMGCELTPGPGGIAEALFVGLATDTGWFRYSNADARSFELAARLLELDIDKTHLYNVIEETFRPQHLALAARALTSLEFARDGTIAVMSLGPDDFAQTGGSMEDLTGIVNAPMSVRGVMASILLAQTKPGKTKISFRSRPGHPDRPDVDAVDVNELAQQFGGGGHVFAAGARIEKDIAEARAAVIEALQTPKASGVG